MVPIAVGTCGRCAPSPAEEDVPGLGLLCSLSLVNVVIITRGLLIVGAGLVCLSLVPSTSGARLSAVVRRPNNVPRTAMGRLAVRTMPRLARGYSSLFVCAVACLVWPGCSPCIHIPNVHEPNPLAPCASSVMMCRGGISSRRNRVWQPNNPKACSVCSVAAAAARWLLRRRVLRCGALCRVLVAVGALELACRPASPVRSCLCSGEAGGRGAR